MEIERLGVVSEWTGGSGDSLHFGVAEFADFVGGDRWELHSDRGWSSGISVSPGSGPVSHWDSLDVDAVINGIYNVLIPDEGDEPDDHDWSRLAIIFDERGLSKTVAELRDLPYIVEFGPKLTAKLAKGDSEPSTQPVDWAEIHARKEQL